MNDSGNDNKPTGLNVADESFDPLTGVFDQDTFFKIARMLIDGNSDGYYVFSFLNIDNFNKIHPFMQKNIIFYILSKIYDNNANIIKDRHITSIISLINNNKPNSYITLPNNYLAQKCYHNLSFIKKDNLKEDYQILFKNNIIMSNIQITEVKIISSDGNDV